MSTELNCPPSSYTAQPEQSVLRYLAVSFVSMVLSITALVILAYITKLVVGQDFIAALATTDFSFFGLIFMGFLGLVYSLLLFLSGQQAGIWGPIKITLLASWLVPSMTGPIGEKISPLAYLLLQLLS